MTSQAGGRAPASIYDEKRHGLRRPPLGIGELTQPIKGLAMTSDEFREAVDSLGDKFLTAITSQTPINIGVTLAAVFHMAEVVVKLAPEDERAILRQALEELL
jgi:hypothetical protein